jgi:hypothetical protein
MVKGATPALSPRLVILKKKQKPGTKAALPSQPGCGITSP